MSTVSITVEQGSQIFSLDMEQGELVSTALRDNHLQPQPCGGAGICGKCLIHAETEPSAEEVKRLTKPALANGLRLACYTKAEEGLVIRIPEQEVVQVETSFSAAAYPYQPLVEARKFPVTEPSLEDQRTDVERVLEACGVTKHSLSLTQLAELPGYLRSRQEGIGLIHDKTLVGFTTSEAHLLLAIDIGTTTIAATLFDLQAQKVLCTKGEAECTGRFWG